MTEYLWTSPGGLYKVPDEWRTRFQEEFPDYRVRWSLRRSQWQIEQRAGRGALPPLRVDAHDDSLIRAADGYWLVMEFQPGDRMACPGVLSIQPREECGALVKVPHRQSKEAICPQCRKMGRDGKNIAAYWPFDEVLLDHLRYSDPLRGGIVRQRKAAEVKNAKILADADAREKDVAHSLDYVDMRWLADIPTSGITRRKVDHTTFA